MPDRTRARKQEGAFKRFLRRLFSIRLGIHGSAADTADLHIESGPSRPCRNYPASRLGRSRSRPAAPVAGPPSHVLSGKFMPISAGRPRSGGRQARMQGVQPW